MHSHATPPPTPCPRPPRPPRPPGPPPRLPNSKVQGLEEFGEREDHEELLNSVLGQSLDDQLLHELLNPQLHHELLNPVLRQRRGDHGVLLLPVLSSSSSAASSLPPPPLPLLISLSLLLHSLLTLSPSPPLPSSPLMCLAAPSLPLSSRHCADINAWVGASARSVPWPCSSQLVHVRLVQSVVLAVAGGSPDLGDEPVH